jgi:phage protein D
MLTPAYKLQLGSKLIDTTDEPRASTVVDLQVVLDLDTPADGFTLVLGNVGSLRPAREDEVEIDLGYAGEDLHRVMVGLVDSVEPNLTITRVAGYGSAAPLLRTYIDQTFEAKTAGEIVRDLAGRASVEVARAEDGIRFPAYVIDGRRSAWHHLRDLADLSGFDLYVDQEGKLVFEWFAGGRTAHLLEYGKHILELEVQRTPARAGRVEAWGESPTGSRGDAAWAWLTTDFQSSRGEAGSGALFLLERPALRTRLAAHAAAQSALMEIHRRTLRGRLVLLGRPQVRLGDAIRLRGLADESLNTFFQVRRIEHRLTKTGGFTTEIGFRSLEVPGQAA